MRRSRVVGVCLAVSVGVMIGASWTAAVSPPQSGPGVTSEHWPSLGIDPQEILLDNRFRIVLVEDHRVPRVAASLQYRFGGLQERNGEHGAAHFLEHAMHQGTTSVGVKDRDVDRRRMSELANAELEKLALYRPGGTVTNDDIEALVAEAVPGSTWAFLDALGSRGGHRGDGVFLEGHGNSCFVGRIASHEARRPYPA